MTIDHLQIRAALALLDWSANDLAEASGLTPDAIRKICRGVVRPHERSAQRMKSAFEERGVEFTPQSGVRLRDDTIVALEGDDCYIRLLDDVYHVMRKHSGEVLFICVDDRISPPEVISANRRIRDAGIRCRYLCEEGAVRFDYPKEDYRLIPSRFFRNAVQVVYADRLATLFGDGTKVLIVRREELADSVRRLFEMIWGTLPSIKE